MKSALVFELAPTAIRAYLFDEVEGRCRFVARGECPLLAYPGDSVAEDALAALAEVERITGRGLVLRSAPLTPEEPDGTGVDVLVALCAPTGGLRVAVLAGDEMLATDAAARAVQTGGHEVAFRLSMDDEALRSSGALHDAVRRLWRTSPDVLLVASRADTRREKALTQLGAALGAVELPAEQAPVVIFAGQTSVREAFDRGLKGRLPVRMVAELRPDQGSENLEACKMALNLLHAERWCAGLPDFARLHSWLNSRPLHRDVALTNVVRYLAAASLAPLWVLDCDHDRLGLWVGGPGVLGSYRAPEGRDGPDCLAWLPEDCPTEGLAVARANRQLRPSSAPATMAEMLWRGADFRSACRQVMEDPRLPLPEPICAPALGQAIATGTGAAWLGDEREAALLVLDALQPTGIGFLIRDEESLLAPLGALGEVEPRLASEALANDATRPLGLYVAPLGQVRVGAEAVALEVTFPAKDSLRMEVVSGGLEVLPLPRGGKVGLRVRPVGALDVGPGRGKQQALEVEALPLGVVVDARGRPRPWRSGEADSRRAASLARRQLGCLPLPEAGS